MEDKRKAPEVEAQELEIQKIVDKKISSFKKVQTILFLIQIYLICSLTILYYKKIVYFSEVTTLLEQIMNKIEILI